MIAKKFRHAIAIFLLAALLALTACGSANNSSTPAADPSSSVSGAGSGGTLVIAMTAANIPIPDTPPTEGGEGYRFVGYQLYDSLVEWDVSRSDKISELRPGLAESWSVSDKDPTLWTFHLRKGVKFHDGEPWNADAAIFAFDRIMNPKFQYYNEIAAANSSSYISSVESYSKVDDYTIQFKTKTPDSYLLYGMSNILYPSPKAVKESGLNFKLKPVGTGPFKFVEMIERDRLVMERNPDYWGGAPKLDRVVLRPMVEPAARLSALMAGEVQWAEMPPVDSVDNLKSKSFQIYTNPYPNIWSYVFNLKEKPFDNVKVRQALNYAIDREGMVKHLLHGAATTATGPMYKGQSWYPEGATVYNYDPAKAKQLLAEAGYPNGFSTKFVIPNGGSGMMWPIQMGEFVQQNLKDIGVNVQFEVIEWNTMRTTYRKGFTAGVGAYNYGWTTLKPDFVEQFYMSTMMTPKGLNPGGYNNPEVDKLFTAARKTFDLAERDKLIAQAIKYVQDDAAWLFVVHDNNLRVLGPKVKGFVQPQSGYADLTKIWMNK